jgi:Cd2+/Zn2+-exporting ATPase
MEHDHRGPHSHDEPHTLGHAATAFSGIDASAPPRSAFRADRSYKVRGLDCAEEVAALKQAVGALVGGADRLAFDVLNGRMSVAANEREVADEAILKAVATTGMSAIPWTPDAKAEDTDDHRRQQALFTAASGIALVIGFTLHVVLAGGLVPAWRLLGSHASASMPLPEIAAYLAAVVLGARFVVVKAWFAACNLRPDMHLLMTVAVICHSACNIGSDSDLMMAHDGCI